MGDSSFVSQRTPSHVHCRLAFRGQPLFGIFCWFSDLPEGERRKQTGEMVGCDCSETLLLSRPLFLKT